MQTDQYINTLNAIEKKYETYIIDVAGVIWDGENSYPSSIETVNRLIEHQKQIIFLSNSPWPSSHLKKQLIDLGIKNNFYAVSSGDLLHHLLNTILQYTTIYHLGRNREHSILKEISIRLTDSIENAQAIIVSCFVEGDEDKEQFNTDLQIIARCKKPIYCPNPDIIAQQGTLLRYPSGYFAQKIINYGGSVIHLGKPTQEIYHFITQKHPYIQINQEKTIMIGDTIETDICGAINFGIDSVLVLTGITALQTNKDLNRIKKYTHQPTYIIDSL